MALNEDSSDSRTAVFGNKRKLPGLFLTADNPSHKPSDKHQRMDIDVDFVPFVNDDVDYMYDSRHRESRESGEVPSFFHADRAESVEEGEIDESVDLDDVEDLAPNRSSSHGFTAINGKSKKKHVNHSAFPNPTAYSNGPQAFHGSVTNKHLGQLRKTEQDSTAQQSTVDSMGKTVHEKLNAKRPLDSADCKWIMKTLTSHGIEISDKGIQHAELRKRILEFRRSKKRQLLPTIELFIRLLDAGGKHAELVRVHLVQLYSQFSNVTLEPTSAQPKKPRPENELPLSNVERMPVPVKRTVNLQSPSAIEDVTLLPDGKAMHFSDITREKFRRQVLTHSKNMPGLSTGSILVWMIKEKKMWRGKAAKTIQQWVTKRLPAGNESHRPSIDASKLNIEELRNILTDIATFVRPMDIRDVVGPRAMVLGEAVRNKTLERSWSETLLHMAHDGEFQLEARLCLDKYVSQNYAGLIGANGKGSELNGELSSPASVGFREEPPAEAEPVDAMELPRSQAQAMPLSDVERILLRQPHLFKRRMSENDFIQVSDGPGDQMRQAARDVRDRKKWSWEQAAVFLAKGTAYPDAARTSIDFYFDQCFLSQSETSNLSKRSPSYVESESGRLSLSNVGGIDPVLISAQGEECWLYIGNLSYKASTHDLRALFRNYQVVEMHLPLNPGTLDPSGQAFVKVTSSVEAGRALRELHGTVFMGRTLSFQLARPTSVSKLDQKPSQIQRARHFSEGGGFPVNGAFANTVPGEDDMLGRRKDSTSNYDASAEEDDLGGVTSIHRKSQAHSYDYGSMARSQAANFAYKVTSPSGASILRDLSAHDQNLQRRYFGITDLDASVRCLSCGKLGHMRAACPLRTCRHCGAVDEHTWTACPTFKKCTRCRQRGHGSVQCTNRSVLGGGPGDPCDLCGDTGHVEEECDYLWRTFFPSETNIKKIPESKMVKGCYACGSSKHWGADCPHVPSSRRHLVNRGSHSIWSADYANKFILGATATATSKEQGKENGSMQNYQLAMLNDMRD